MSYYLAGDYYGARRFNYAAGDYYAYRAGSSWSTLGSIGGTITGAAGKRLPGTGGGTATTATKILKTSTAQLSGNSTEP